MRIKALKEDLYATAKRNMELSKENHIDSQISWAVQKKSPYLNPQTKIDF